MKDFVHVPVSLCEFACKHNHLPHLSAYLCLQINGDGTLQLKEVRRLLKTLPGLTSLPSIRKVLAELISMNWVGLNQATNLIHVRSVRRVCRELGLSPNKVFRFHSSELHQVKYFAYGSVINAKLIQQCTAIKLQKSRIPVANKSEATVPGSYPGLGKNGLSKLLMCSPTKALRIKSICAKHGYIQVHRKARKIMELSQADYQLSPFLRDIFPEKSFLFSFRKNVITGKVEVYERLYDEIVPLMKIKKRGNKRFDGIFGHSH
jgi:hypothetical protein